MPPQKLSFTLKETSVWRLVARLRLENILPSGYFDFSKVFNLRVYAGVLVKKYRKIMGMSQKELAESLSVERGEITNWEYNVIGIPFSILLKIANLACISKEDLIKDIERNKLKFSMHSRPTEVPFRVSELKVSYLKTLIPRGNNKLYFKSTKLSKSMIVLNKFLTTFFDYNIEFKINPPLTSIVKKWLESNVDLNIPISILLLTEGSVDKSKGGLMFLNNSKILHDILVDCIYQKYKLLPTSYFIERKRPPKKSIHITEYFRLEHQKIKDSILSLIKNLKTAPHDTQTIEEYLSEPQPTLDFILYESLEDKIVALNLFLATEGSVYITTRFGYVYPVIEIGCTNPSIVNFLENLSKDLNLNFKRAKTKKTWSGLKGVRARGLAVALKLLKLGGFTPDVKITSKSKYFEGFKKQELLLAILELHRRQEIDKKLWNIHASKANEKIFKILKAKGFRSPKFYIEYFTKKEKVRKWL